MHWTFVICVVFGSCFCVISEGSTPIRKCTEELPHPHSVQINDCEAYPCNLFAGSTSNMTIQFAAVNNNTENIHAEIIAYVNDDAFPVQLPNDVGDVCRHLGNDVHCPLNSGDIVSYSFTLPLEKNVPDMFLEVEVALVDDDKNTCISCFVADIRVHGHGHGHNHMTHENAKI